MKNNKKKREEDDKYKYAFEHDLNEDSFGSKTNTNSNRNGSGSHKKSSKTAGEKSEKSPDIDLEIDPERTYFFVFGLEDSGKSVMLSGLIYYLKTKVAGRLDVVNSNNKMHHRKGDFMMRNMIKCVRSGRFVNGTKPADKLEPILPNEVNLNFDPDDEKKPEMPFCLLDVAGEDFKSVLFSNEGYSGGELAPELLCYLTDEKISLVFILVINIDQPEESEDLIDRFLDYSRSLGHATTPIVFAVNKWDKKREEYDSVETYFKEKFPMLAKRRKDRKRFSELLDFSIGEVFYDDLGKENFYNYESRDSERLMRWMYEVTTGVPMDTKIKMSDLESFIQWFKKRH